jgi:hypothetical protein
LPTAVGTCLGEEFVLCFRLKSWKICQLRPSKGTLAICHNDKKPSLYTALSFTLSALLHVASKFEWNFYLTSESRQNPLIERLSL